MYKYSNQLLWNRYFLDRSEANRNALVGVYMYIAKGLAEWWIGKLPNWADVDDVRSDAAIGLMDAITKYDVSKGTTFATIAPYRILGSITDGLRNRDHVPRAIRRRERAMELLVEECEQQFGQQVSDEVVADGAGVSMEQLWTMKEKARIPSELSLYREVGETDSGKYITRLDMIADDRVTMPSTTLERNDIKALLMLGLTHNEQLAVQMYYYDELTMREVAKAIGVCESWVSYILDSVRDRLKACLAQEILL